LGDEPSEELAAFTENSEATPYSKKPSFTETGLKTLITEFALALMAWKDDHWTPSGTAVLVGGYGLAMTANHVITDYWDRYERAPLSEGNSEGSFQIMALQMLDGGEIAAPWLVHKIWLSPYTDAAFLGLAPAAETEAVRDRQVQGRGVRMNLLPPSVGSRVVAFGYHSPNIEIREQEGEGVIKWNDSPTTSVGQVLEVYEHGRDTVMLPFPCYRTNARSKPGMSGAPVFNDSGPLCGLISTAMEGGEDEGDHIYYAAALWPSMGTQIDAERPGFPAGVSYPALELAKHGYIAALHWDKVVLREDPPGVGLR
jgi:hypothetical protein